MTTAPRQRSATWPAALALLALLVAGFFAGPSAPAQAAPAAPPIAVFDQVDIPTTTTADVCTNALTPSARTSTTGASLAYRVTVAVMPGSTATVLNVVETRSTTGAASYLYPLNSGTALTAGNLYTFTFGASNLSTYNFRASTASSRVKLLVEEIVDNHL